MNSDIKHRFLTTGNPNWPGGLKHVDERIDPEAGFGWLTFVATGNLGQKHKEIDEILEKIITSTDGRIQKDTLPRIARYARTLKFTLSIENPVDEAKVILRQFGGIID